VSGLTPAFFLKAETASGSAYAIAAQTGVADVNPVTTIAVAAASSSSDAEESWSGHDSHSSDHIGEVIQSLGNVLKPLFDLYGITRIGGGDDDHHDGGNHMRALLHDVSFKVDHGLVTVTNIATGGVIFKGPLKDLSSGTFFPENMPSGPGGGSTTCTSFTYSAWGSCQSNNTQTRTVLTSSPTGCTGGSPVLTQACTYVPPPTTCTSFTYSAWGSCQSNNTQTRTVLTSSPTGCTGGSPVLTQACTYVPPPTTCTSFTYSAWGSCQSNNTQTRTVLTSSPTGCTGGSPVLTQACTYVPPVTCTLATAVPSCSTCHGALGSGTHAARPLTCANCHGPVNNGSGTPSTGMAAALSGTTCRLTYPTSGTHDNGVTNFGAAQ
jgi:hypothetical protein